MELSKIIQYIREESALSQEEFAKKIGVGRIAVTRWENDKAVPNRIAQAKIYEITKKNGIPLFSHLTKDLPEHEVKDEKIILYHGSKSGIKGEIRPISRDLCDFGKGFYMGTLINQPLTLIYSFERPAVYTLELDLRGLKVLRIPPGVDWAMLIAYSRGILENKAKPAFCEKYRKMLDGYDVVIGAIADDRLFYVLDRFFMGDVTDKGLIESLSAVQLGEQYVALTERACRQIRILERMDLSELENLCIGDISEENRKIGVETANEICRTHRREGRFFDEILRGG